MFRRQTGEFLVRPFIPKRMRQVKITLRHQLLERKKQVTPWRAKQRLNSFVLSKKESDLREIYGRVVLIAEGFKPWCWWVSKNGLSLKIDS